jgi:NAD(P)-dependent dehydrogenase (short-subunit alcohol dehydrogenase family)
MAIAVHIRVLPEREDRDSGTHLELFRRMTMPLKPSVLITGASTGIGAVYADRFARRGHDLVLVARDRARMDELADRLRRESGVAVEVLRADLTDARDFTQVESRVREDTRIGILVNNAGMSAAGGFLDQSADDVTRIVNLNAMALLCYGSPTPSRRDSQRRAATPLSISVRLSRWRRNSVPRSTARPKPSSSS